MLPIERQKRINQMIQDKKSIKIADLSKELGVSEMTIHRDIKPLIEDGLVAKTFGGITLITAEVSEHLPETCVICSRIINEKMAFRLILANDKIEIACCAHCGLLRHHQLGKSVMQAICYDFLRQTTISAKTAWYVMDTTINMGCCQPQVLAFEWEKHANNFIKGFGGKVYSFNTATEEVIQKMNDDEHDCH